MTGLAVLRETCTGEELPGKETCPDLTIESYPGTLIAESES